MLAIARITSQHHVLKRKRKAEDKITASETKLNEITESLTYVVYSNYVIKILNFLSLSMYFLTIIVSRFCKRFTRLLKKSSWPSVV